MGAKHSKPRIRRNRRFSSLRKRQAPEGSNDPVEPPTETWNNNKPGVEECCKYCGSTDKCSNNISGEVNDAKISDDVTKRRIHNEEKKSYFEDIMKEDLKVDIPRSPECYRSCVSKEKSKSLPPKSSMQNCNKLKDHTNEEEQEWTITLYEIDKMAGRVPREDMVRLMSSIYEAVDAKVGDSPQGRKTVRVRLSVTPERHSHSRLRRASSTPYKDHSECRCSNCPRTEPIHRRISGENKVERRQGGDVSPLRRSTTVPSTTPLSKKTPNSFQRSRLPRDLSENTERRKHYAKLEGLDNNMHLHKKEKDNSMGAKYVERTNSLPHARHRTVTKYDDRQPSKHRQRHHANDQRNVMLRMRRKDPRFASPYDQHFQEAMYLRLRELQRQGALELRKAKGGQDSDEADDDSDYEKTDKKCDGVVEAGGAENKVVSTLPDVLTSPIDAVENDISSGATSIHHHHHYHHGVPTSSVTTALSSPDSVAVKCITSAANLTCSSIVSNADGADDSTQHHHHHYHHHYHHADSHIKEGP